MNRPTCVLTERDEAILDTLTKRVRVLSLRQVANEWWGGQGQSIQSAKRRLDALVGASMLCWFEALAHPDLPLEKPLVVWKPGDQAPDFGAVSYQLKRRWTCALQLTATVVATKGAGNQRAGSGGRMPRASELTHDLHLATIYLRLRRDEPHRAQEWTSEATQYAHGGGRGERLPDALVGRTGRQTAIEFGGAYSKQKLAEFHEHCVDHELPYELW